MMKRFSLLLLLLVPALALADISHRNGIAITTASTINGISGPAAINGITITGGGGGDIARNAAATPLEVPTAAETHDMSITTTATTRLVVTIATRTATVSDVRLDPTGANTAFTQDAGGKLVSTTGSRTIEYWHLSGVSAGTYPVRIYMNGQTRTLIATLQGYTNVASISYTTDDNPLDFSFAVTTVSGDYVIAGGALADGETDPTVTNGTEEAIGFHTDEATWGIMSSMAATTTTTTLTWAGSNEGGGVLLARLLK